MHISKLKTWNPPDKPHLHEAAYWSGYRAFRDDNHNPPDTYSEISAKEWHRGYNAAYFQNQKWANRVKNHPWMLNEKNNGKRRYN